MKKPPKSEKKHKILIADDDENFRILARACLEDAGFVVEDVDNGLKAIDSLEKSPPDAILLDIQMMGVDGYSICTYVRKHYWKSQIPIVVITGLEDLDSINKAFEVGATDFMTKPVHWDLLGERIKFILQANNEFKRFMQKEIMRQAKHHTLVESQFFADDAVSLQKEILQNISLKDKEKKTKILDQVIHNFIRYTEEIIDRISSCHQQDDFHQMKIHFFHLRSNCNYIGAFKLALLCRDMEQAMDQLPPYQMKELIADLKTEFSHLKQILLNEMVSDSFDL